jgi:hypothetical protein
MNMKRFISVVILLGVLFLSYQTNPSRSEYVEWLNNKALDQSTNVLERGVISLVGKQVSDAMTTRKDYYIFSIYTTDLTDLGQGKMTSIGIFNQFFTFSK